MSAITRPSSAWKRKNSSRKSASIPTWCSPAAAVAPTLPAPHFPFLADKAAGDPKAKNLRLVAAEPTSCPTLTRGHYAYDFGDAVGLTPLMLMYTLGHDFMPPGIHAGGLRYHGDSPLVSQLYHEKMIEAVAVPQIATFEAGVTFSRAEGIIPAPESCHAIRACIDEALRCKETGEPKTLFFDLLRATAISTCRPTIAISPASWRISPIGTRDRSRAGTNEKVG